jgi:hypothetical protein
METYVKVSYYLAEFFSESNIFQINAENKIKIYIFVR